MANRYWINTAGGNWSDTGNWSTTSGGTGGASVPSSVDDVFINLAGTYTITLDVIANCLSLDFTGSTSVTLARGSNILNIYGSLIHTSSTVQSGSSIIYMKSTGTCSVDTKGSTLGSGAIYIDGVGGTFNITSTFNSSSCDFNVRNGTFNTNNYNITCWIFDISYTSARTINLGSSTITITTNFNATTTTNLTFNASISTIKINGSSAYTSNLGNLTYYNFEINSTSGTTIVGSNTFNTLKIYAGKTLKLTSGTTQTVTNLDAIGTSGSIITIQSTTSGSPATISKASGTVTVDYCSIKDITATGGATFNATNSTNVSGNTGWTFIGSNNSPSVPNGLSSSNITTSGFRLSWNTSTDAEGDNPVTYKVYKGGILYQSGITATYLDITGQTSGTSADWTVSAVDSGSRESSQSSVLNVIMGGIVVGNEPETIPILENNATNSKFPKIYESGVMFQLFQAEDQQINRFNTEVVSLLNQFFIDLADVTLERWEQEIGLPVNPIKSKDERRSNIKAKLRGYGAVSVAMVKNVAEAYSNGEVEIIETSASYEFEVKFTSVKGIPPNIDDLKALIEQIKPAHLKVNYTYLYNTHSMLTTKTHTQLSAYTHDQLKTVDL